MQGTDLLAQSREMYPLARRVLLTAYADIDAAVQGDQRGASRSLPVETVGSAGGAAVSRDRRSARRLAGGVSARGEGAAAGRPPVVAAIARDQGLPRRQPDSVPLAGRGRAIRTPQACWTPPAIEPDELPALFFEDGTVLRNPEPRAGRRASRPIALGRARSLRPRDRRRRSGRPRRRRCTARRKVCERSCSIGTARAGRRAPARGSRTIWGFPPASAAAI